MTCENKARAPMVTANAGTQKNGVPHTLSSRTPHVQRFDPAVLWGFNWRDPQSPFVRRTSRHRRPSTVPLCVLHGLRIVTRLPEGCPLSWDNCLEGLTALRDMAWTPGGNLSALLDRLGVCNQCVADLQSHPHVKTLRRAQCTIR